MQRRLHAFVADAARVGRSAFGGRLSYAAAQDDVVDWGPFDVVGIDYYSNFPRRAQHVRALARLARWGKPVAIAEFGTCTYEGAARRGGMAWDALDATGERLKRGLVRSERAQARYLVELLRIFEAVGLDTATVTSSSPRTRPTGARTASTSTSPATASSSRSGRRPSAPRRAGTGSPRPRSARCARVRAGRSG